MNKNVRPAHTVTGAVLAAACVLTACGSSGTAASTEYVEPSLDECEVLGGKDVTLTVPFSPGGGYDSYARLVAPVLGEKIGSTVVVVNEEGAGGLLAMKNLLRADPDGTEIAIMNGIGTGGASIGGADGVNFAMDEFSYVGRVAGDEQIIVTRSGSDYPTWEDVVTADNFRFGSTGMGASDFVTPSVMIAIFDLNAEIVTGFPGSSENELALLQGSIDGMSGPLDSRAPSLRNGDTRPLLMIDSERAELAPDTPTLDELELSAEQRDLADAHLRLLSIGRPLVGPTNMDGRALACLRAGLAETLADPGLIATAEQTNRPLGYQSGEELTETVTALMDAPPAYGEVLKESFGQ